MMMKSFVVLCIALVATFASAADQIPPDQAQRILAAAPASPRVQPRQPRRVLIWNTPAHLMDKDPHKGYCIPYGAAAFQSLGDKTKAFKPVVSDDLAMYLPENLRRFDAIVMNNSSGPWITPTDADMARPEFAKLGDKSTAEQVLRKSLVDFIENGGGVVGIHFAIAANAHWPAFQQIFGGKFTMHPWNEEVAVMVEEPTHPLVAAFGGKDFRITDEIYQYGQVYDRSKLRVLLSLDTSRTNMGVKWIDRLDNDFALAWVKSVGKGRVFYTSFGHRTELYWNKPLLQFYLDAIQFATGDLDAPTTPRGDNPIHIGPGPTPPETRAAMMKARNLQEPTSAQIAQIESAAPRSAPAKPLKPRKLLVWGHTWAHEPNATAEKALEILGRKTGAFKVTISDDPRLLIGDRLPQFDCLVLNNIHETDPFLPVNFKQLDAAQQAAARKLDASIKQGILEFVRGGKGIVGIHAATCALQNWPEYGQMIGGYYSAHIFQDVAIRPEEPRHPLCAFLDGKTWRINDEVYIFREPYSRKDRRVLLSLDLTQMPDPAKRADKDYPISWVSECDKGRVFYTTLGHANQTYANPLFLQHLLAGIQFATGDLPAPAAPR